MVNLGAKGAFLATENSDGLVPGVGNVGVKDSIDAGQAIFSLSPEYQLRVHASWLLPLILMCSPDRNTSLASMLLNVSDRNIKVSGISEERWK